MVFVLVVLVVLAIWQGRPWRKLSGASSPMCESEAGSPMCMRVQNVHAPRTKRIQPMWAVGTGELCASLAHLKQWRRR